MLMRSGFALVVLTASTCGLNVGTSVGVSDYRVTPCDFGHRRLLLVRHGAVAPEAHDPPLRLGAVYSSHDVPLSAAGAAEATAIASLIASAHGHEVRRLCASPLAMHSGRLISRAVGPLVRSQNPADRNNV